MTIARFLLGATALAASAGAAHATLIQVTSGASAATRDVGVFAISGGLASDNDTVSSFPYSNTLAANRPGVDCDASIDLSDTFFDTSWTFDMSGASSPSGVGGMTLAFTALQDVDWEMTGTLSYEGDTANGVGIIVALDDVTSSARLTLNRNESTSVSAEFLEFGVVSGNSVNTIGAMSGTLLTGHDYVVNFGAFTQLFGNPVSGFTEVTFTMSFSPAFNPIPAPGAVALLGLSGLVGARRRRGGL